MAKDPRTVRSSKVKVTVTLDADLAEQLNARLVELEASSRSYLVEQALRKWLNEFAEKDLERQTELYYRSLSQAERSEDRSWSKLAAKSAKRTWRE